MDVTLPIGKQKTVNFAELYVRFELKAVMKVKELFYDWFENTLRQIV